MTAGQISIDLPAVASNCARCASRFQDYIVSLRGIDSAEVDARSRKLRITYEPEKVDIDTIDRFAADAGTVLVDRYRHAEYAINGMSSAEGAVSVASRVSELQGVLAADVDFGTATLSVEFEEGSTGDLTVIATVGDLGYRAVTKAAESNIDDFLPSALRSLMDREHGMSTFGAVALLAAGWSAGFTPAPEWLWRVIIALSILIGGAPIARRAIRALRFRRMADINVLMVTAVIGAVAIDQWLEAALVVVLFSIGEAFEDYTMERARGSVRNLLEEAPAQARVLRSELEDLIPALDVVIDDRIAVHPGERIPADGRLLTGTTTVNEAPISGESTLVPKDVGDRVYAGTINDAGFFEMIADRPGADTTLARIVRMIDEAQASRAPVQRFVDRFARTYTPVVVVAAIAVAAIPPLAFGQPFGDWLFRALVLIVIACPCALVISTPAAIAAALWSASRNGVLFKGGAFLEALSKVRTIAFDKTGTLTRGMPAVTEVIPFGGESEAEILNYAAAIERRSEHPLARAIRRAAVSSAADDPTPDVADLEIIPGHGVAGTLDGHAFVLGSPAFVNSRHVDVSGSRSHLDRLSSSGKTPVLLGRDRHLLALIATADEIREEAAPALRELQRLGVRNRVVLSGDRRGAARAVASDLAISDLHGELLPEDKVAIIRELARSDGPVAMVGDGINDAPALAAADIGIAMGVVGTDAALETADVALMRDRLCRLPEAIELSRRTMKTIRFNVALALATKALFLVLAVAGISSLWMAVLADVGASVAVTLFGLRLVRHPWHSHEATTAHTRHQR